MSNILLVSPYIINSNHNYYHLLLFINSLKLYYYILILTYSTTNFFIHFTISYYLSIIPSLLFINSILFIIIITIPIKLYYSLIFLVVLQLHVLSVLNYL